MRVVWFPYVQPSPLHDRLGAILADLNYRQVGDLTSTNAETARRYMTGAPPSVEFLAAVCTKLEVNAEWLLTGRGVIKRKDVRGAALREANVGELLTSLAQTLERLISRVDRLEVFVHSMETRIRAAGPMAVAELFLPEPDQRGGADGRAEPPTPVVPTSERAESVANALDYTKSPTNTHANTHAQRPRPRDR